MDLRAIWEEAVDEGVKVVRQEWYTKGNELRAVCMNSKKKKKQKQKPTFTWRSTWPQKIKG